MLMGFRTDERVRGACEGGFPFWRRPVRQASEMVSAWLLAGAATVEAAVAIVLRSGQVRGQRLRLNERLRGWAALPWALIGPTVATAYLQARDSAGPAVLVLASAVAAVAVVLVGGRVWHNRYRAGAG